MDPEDSCTSSKGWKWFPQLFRSSLRYVFVFSKEHWLRNLKSASLQSIQALRARQAPPERPTIPTSVEDMDEDEAISLAIRLSLESHESEAGSDSMEHRRISAPACLEHNRPSAPSLTYSPYPRPHSHIPTGSSLPASCYLPLSLFLYLSAVMLGVPG